MRALPQPPLMVISDRRQAAHGLTAIADSLLEAGCRWLSLREKDLPPGGREQLLKALRPAFDDHSACLSLHDTGPELAAEMGLGALHLSSQGDLREARRILGDGVLIGISCHGAEDLARAAGEGADYATLSPFFESTSKPGYEPLPAGAAADALAQARLPVLALGGIENPQRAKACRSLGAAGLAVMGSLMRARDPGAAFAALLAGWRAGE